MGRFGRKKLRTKPKSSPIMHKLERKPTQTPINRQVQREISEPGTIFVNSTVTISISHNIQNSN